MNIEKELQQAKEDIEKLKKEIKYLFERIKEKHEAEFGKFEVLE